VKVKETVCDEAREDQWGVKERDRYKEYVTRLAKISGELKKETDIKSE